MNYTYQDMAKLVDCAATVIESLQKELRNAHATLSKTEAELKEWRTMAEKEIAKHQNVGPFWSTAKR
jgi:hypothetical protein